MTIEKDKNTFRKTKGIGDLLANQWGRTTITDSGPGWIRVFSGLLRDQTLPVWKRRNPTSTRCFSWALRWEHFMMLRKLVSWPSWLDINHCYIAFLQPTPGHPCGRRCVSGSLHVALPCGQKEAHRSRFKGPISPESTVRISGEI